MTKPKAKNDKVEQFKAADYEHIGRTLETIVISGYASKRRLFFANFLRGTFFGLGSALGATIAVAVIVFFLSLGSEVPLIGRFFENLQQTVENANPDR